MAAQLVPKVEDFVWGDREITGDGVVVMEHNSDGGYRCPICKENFNTKREDTFKKHFNPKRKGATDTAKHLQCKEAIPSMKERCARCNKPGDPNPGKKRKHLVVCRENLFENPNPGKKRKHLETMDDADQNDNLLDEDIVQEESIEIEDEEYEDMFVNVEEKKGQEEEMDEEGEDSEIEPFGENENEQHKEVEESDTENEEFSKLKENVVESNKVIFDLRKKLEVSENKHKEEEKKTKELVEKCNSFMKMKDAEAKEMEQSLTTLEDARLEQIGVLEQKLKIATELFEEIKDIDGTNRDLEAKIVYQQNELDSESQIKKDLQTKVLKLEEKVKETEGENMRVRKEAKDSKAMLEKVVKQMNKLETEVLDMSNQTEDLERELSELKREKTESNVKLSMVEEHEKIIDQLQSSLDKMNKETKDVANQNINLTKDVKSLKKKKDLLESKLQTCKNQVETMSKLPMIKSIKIDSEEGETAVGEGTYGTIIKVKENGKPIAVKKAAISSVSITEALAMAKFNHPHVVSASGVSIQKDQLLISMEMYDEDLSIFLEKMERIKDDKSGWRIKVFKDTAGGLSYLHKLQIIHRDLKPQNILLKHRGDSISASIADFGTAHFGLQGSQWCGSTGFIAPEMFTDGQVPTYNELVDEWSLGASMYELIFCDSLVKGEDYEEQVNPNPRWDKVKVRIPSFITALKGLLVIEPRRRKSVEEILRTL